MASSGCLKCVSRPSPFQLTPSLHISRATFSTTPASGAAKASTTKQILLNRKPPTLRLKKKSVVKSGKPPIPGERKALRKRVVLSNTNALDVGLKDLNSKMVMDGDLVGHMVGLDGKTVDCLRAAEAFKSSQGWGLFRRPGLLVRQESVLLGEKLVGVEKEKATLKLVLDGDRGTGKSLMTVYAMATAAVRGWITFHIPEAQELTNAVTEYEPIPDTTPTLYAQNNYVAAWLTRISKSNATILNSLELSLKHDLPIPIQSNITLFRLCELGARDPDVAWPIFQALWKELTIEGRPPILMSMDSVQFAMQNTLYNAPGLLPIHAHDLAIIKHFTDYLSGAQTLPNGGAIIAATQRSHAPTNITTDLVIKQIQDKQKGYPPRNKNPYEKNYDSRVEKVLANVEVMKLKGISKLEARGLMEYWAQSGLLRSVVDEKTVTEKWALAGNGVVGEIERGTLRMRI